jgi:transmembrane protein 17
MTYFDLSFFHLFLIHFLYAIFLLVEALRLWLGFSGNMRERVPEIAGCFLFSIFPQIVISLYFMSLQPLSGYGFTMALEYALNIVYLALLLPQVVLSYLAAKHIVQAQTANFFLRLKDDFVPLKRPKVSKRVSRPVEMLSWSSLESFW